MGRYNNRLLIAKQCFAKTLGLISLLIILFAIPYTAKAACNATAAQLCAAVDDEAWIYINGTYIDFFGYVNWDQTGVYPHCMSLSGAELALLTDTGDEIAVEDFNTNCCEIWGAFAYSAACPT